jgi:signal transduction histidine kinase
MSDESINVQLEIERDLKSAEASLKDQQELLACLSGRLREPLSLLLGMTELMLKTELDDDQGKYVSVIRGSAKALLDVASTMSESTGEERPKSRPFPSEFGSRSGLPQLFRSWFQASAMLAEKIKLKKTVPGTRAPVPAGSPRPLAEELELAASRS